MAVSVNFCLFLSCKFKVDQTIAINVSRFRNSLSNGFAPKNDKGKIPFISWNIEESLLSAPL